MTQSLLYSHAQSSRLDSFLAQQQRAPSRAQAAKWVGAGHVLVNGKAVKASHKLQKGDRIQIDAPAVQSSDLQAEAIPLTILYEDKDLLLVHKPAYMVVHPGAGHTSGTLTHALLAHCKGLSQIGGVERPGLVHRLDKGTSGVMVVAKNDKTHLALAEQFKNHEVEKIYWALVYGCPQNKKATIATYVTRSPRHRKKFAVSQTKGKKAITHYQVINEALGFSLLELKIDTGRTHQIRVHLTDKGHSVVGDPLYGGHKKRLKIVRDTKIKNYLQALDHTLLHAKSLKFVHPTTGKKMFYEAEVPDDFEKAIDLIFD